MLTAGVSRRLLGPDHPKRLDSGLVLSGLLVSSSTLPMSSASLKEALWMIWALWRPRCSRAFSRVRDDFLCTPPFVLPLAAASPAAAAAASAGWLRSRSGFRFPASILGNLQLRPPPPLLLLAFSLSDPGEVTTPSCCRSAASGGGRYWMARRPL